jgi:hypothetical protein
MMLDGESGRFPSRLSVIATKVRCSNVDLFDNHETTSLWQTTFAAERENMKARMGNLLLALFVSVLAGCASGGLGSGENLDSIQQQLLGDMPLPQGAKIDNDQSLILGGGPQWTGRVVVSTPQRSTDTFIFFRDQLPGAGWAGVSSIMAKTSILVFVKGDRTVTVEIKEGGLFSFGSSVVSLTAAPKGGTGPVNTNPPNRTR